MSRREAGRPSIHRRDAPKSVDSEFPQLAGSLLV
jgi:hypothetical protein